MYIIDLDCDFNSESNRRIVDLQFLGVNVVFGGALEVLDRVGQRHNELTYF